MAAGLLMGPQYHSPSIFRTGGGGAGAAGHIAAPSAAFRRQSSCAVLTGAAAQRQPAPPPPALPSALGVRFPGFADLSPPPAHGAQLRVAYQGIPGAYADAAVSATYPGCDGVPCGNFSAAFEAVEHWLADRAFLPVENSIDGCIHRNYDLLLRHRLHIVGEVQLPVQHCLLALPGVRRDSITRVISHPQALQQCSRTMDAMGLHRASKEPFGDAAGAAEFIARNALRDTAAIASARAAEVYGLGTVAAGIQDDACNVTRFLTVAREPVAPRTDRPFKTSIVFSCRGSASLFKVLLAFAFRDIKVTKIESRPHRHRPLHVIDDAATGGSKKLFEYMYYIDFAASMAEARAHKALAEVQEFTPFLRVLGSYPMDMAPWSPLPDAARDDPICN